MKKKILFIILIILAFVVTGCGTNNSNSSNAKNSKEYKINGISFKLDKEDSRDGIKYNYSSAFDSKHAASTTTYKLYYDKTKDKYDISNIAFYFYVTADIMQQESNLEKDIAKIKNNSSLKNITREKKTINGITWEYLECDNYYETGSDKHIKNHTYLYEVFDGKYYVTYTISLNKVENMEEFENDFLNNITFEK